MRGRRRSTAALVAALLAALFAPFLLGLGPGDGPLVFVEETPLKLSLDKAKGGVYVGVCNLGDTELTGLEATLDGFNFPGNEGMRVPSGFKSALSAGECTRISVKSEDDLAPGADTYRGLLILRANGVAEDDDEVGVERIARKVAVEVPAAALREPASVAAQPVRVTNKLPSFLTQRSFTPRLSPESAELRLPLALDTEPLPSSSVGELLGTLSGGRGDGFAEVRAGPTDKVDDVDDTLTFLPIRLDGADGVGTYSGTLALGPDGEKVPLKVSVLVTDNLWWAVVAALLGIAASAMLLVLTRRCLPLSKLKGRCDKLAATYEEALKRFKERFEDQMGECYELDDRSLTDYQERLRIYLEHYRKGHLFVDAASPDYKVLATMLETAEADALHLKDPEGFGGCLEDLRAAVNDLAAYSRDGLMLDRDPALVDEAATLLRGGKLGVGAATEISARAREYVKLLAAWRKDAARARRYDHWAQALEEKLASEGHDPSAEDLTALFEARVKIAEAQNELLYAEDALDLERSGVIGDLKQAYETLARLGASVAVWESVGEEPRADSRRSARRRVQRQGIAEENSHESSGPIGRFPADGGGRAAEPLLLVRGRRPVEMGRWFRLAPTLLGLALALLIAVSALLVAGLYPETNEPFGTTRDYIAAFAAGATGPAAAQFLQGPLTSFLARPRS